MSSLFDRFPVRRALSGGITRVRRTHGLRRRATLERLEGRVVMDASLSINSANQLVFVGDATADDVTVSFSPNPGGGTYTISDVGININVTNNGTNVTTNGSGTSAVTVQNLSNLNTATLSFDGAASDDIFNIESINDATTLDDQGIDNDHYNIGNSTNGVQSINGALFMASAGLAIINIDDSANSAADPNVVITENSTTGQVTGLGPDEMTYDLNSVDSLQVSGGSGGNGFSYNSHSPFEFATQIFSGVGADTVNVMATSGPLTIHGQTGADTVLIGDQGSLSDIKGDINIDNFGNRTAIAVDDSADTSDTAGVLSSLAGDGVLTGFSQGSISYLPTDVSRLAITSGTGTDSLTVDFSAGDPVPQNFDPGVLYNGGGGLNTLFLQGGSFENEQYVPFAPIGNAGSFRFSQDTDQTIVDFTGLKPVFDTVTVTGTFTVTAPTNTLNVGDGPIQGGVQTATISSGDTPSAFELVHFGDKANVVVNTTSPSAPSGVTVNVDDSTTPVGLTTLTVNATNLDDLVHVTNSPPNVVTQVNGLAGTDNFFVALAGAPASSPSTPVATVDGGSGLNTLTVDASGALTPVDTSTSGIISGQFPSGTSALAYANFQSVVVNNNPSEPPTVTALPFSIYQGQNLVDIPVATFTSTDLGAKAGDFTATIDWGDGTVGNPDRSAGVIVQDAQNPSVFHVTGTHQYALQGSYNVTVSVLHSTSTQTTTTVNGTTLTINTVTPSGTAPTTATSTATVNPSPLSLQAFPLSGVEGSPLSGAVNQVLASFTDSGGFSTASDYTVTINWGDGTANFVGTPGQLITQTGTNTNGANFSVAVPPHHYNEEGQFVVTVTITNIQNSANPVSVSASSLALIADAPLSPANIPTLMPIEGVPFNNTVVGSFTDSNSAGDVSDFTATIDWGDGSPSSIGHVETLLGAPAQTYFVTGTHTYANALINQSSGTFAITITVLDKGGASVQTSTMVVVQNRPFTVTGNLNPASDTGVSDTDDITRLTQPNFVGHSDPGSTVQLYSYTSANPTPVLIGQGTTGSSGLWSITPFAALAQGTYTIAALATNATGFTTESAVIVPSLVVDTQGPVVNSVFFDRVNGQIDVTFQDHLSGVAGRTMVDAANYRLTKPASPHQLFLVNKISVTADAANPLIDHVVLTINDGRQIRGGQYLFTIKGTDPVTDNAGNALQGVFYGYSPSGNGHNGTNFVARLGGIHNVILPPGTIFGNASPNNPRGTKVRGITHIPTANPHTKAGNPNQGAAVVPAGQTAAKHHHG